jgi:hypothetical protein
MQQIELNTPFNLNLNMNNIISKSNKNFGENSFENDLKLYNSKIQNRSRIIKPNSVNGDQSKDNFKNDKSKLLFL